MSKHAQNGVDCTVCHGSKHTTDQDANLAELPTAGKHAMAWASTKATPTFHWQAMSMTDDGMKGCGGCHKPGLASKW